MQKLTAIPWKHGQELWLLLTRLPLLCPATVNVDVGITLDNHDVMPDTQGVIVVKAALFLCIAKT